MVILITIKLVLCSLRRKKQVILKGAIRGQRVVRTAMNHHSRLRILGRGSALTGVKDGGRLKGKTQEGRASEFSKSSTAQTQRQAHTEKCLHKKPLDQSFSASLKERCMGVILCIVGYLATS